ncbi:YbaB/EbfC family nucleoid-associated protein, partial [Streptomyces sp. NPDC057654]|uniref:YbaB/EbfC family nucleoid-associated protein n=1 Tax=Streptomyces sp. NPDC057654 TaxID=3346196 RepID=UPI00369E70FF
MTDRPSIDIAALTERVRHLQGDLSGLREDLDSCQATGHGGGGLVTATVSGEGRLTDLRIDPSVIDPDDPRTLTDLVIEAVGAAQSTVTELRTERVGEFTGGLNDLTAGLREHTEQSRRARAQRPAFTPPPPVRTAPGGGGPGGPAPPNGGGPARGPVGGPA